MLLAANVRHRLITELTALPIRNMDRGKGTGRKETKGGKRLEKLVHVITSCARCNLLTWISWVNECIINLLHIDEACYPQDITAALKELRCFEEITMYMCAIFFKVSLSDLDSTEQSPTYRY